MLPIGKDFFMASMAEYCLTAMSQWKSFDVLAYKEYTAHNSGTCTDPFERSETNHYAPSQLS
jgi:hypothetical protein